jgi:hypothetical protein
MHPALTFAADLPGLMSFIHQLVSHEYLYRAASDEEEEVAHMSTVSAASAYVVTLLLSCPFSCLSFV